MSEESSLRVSSRRCCVGAVCVAAIVLAASCGVQAQTLSCLVMIPGDFDGDQDVDHDDYLFLAGCSSGPTIAVQAGCLTADLDQDGDVDQSDFGAFQACYSGQDVPGDPACYRLPPRAVTTTVTGEEDVPVVFSLEGCDNSGPAEVLIATVARLPEVGALTQYDDTPITTVPTVIADTQRRLKFTAPPNRNGAPLVHLGYFVTRPVDGATSRETTVNVNIAPVPDRPVSQTMDITATEDTPLIFHPFAADPDLDNEGDHLTFRITRTGRPGKLYQVEADNVTRGEYIDHSAPGGTIAVTNPSGLLWFEPRPDEYGPFYFAFTFDVVDQFGLVSDGYMIRIAVAPVNDPPYAFPSVSTGYSDEPASVVILSFGDVDSPTQIICITEFPAKGKLYANNALLDPDHNCYVHQTNALLYVKDDPWGYEVPYDTFSYTVTDEGGLTATAAGNIINIEYRDLPPVVTSPTSVECMEDSAGCNIPVVGTDPDNDPVTILLVEGPRHGKLYWGAMQIPGSSFLVPEQNSTVLKYVPDPNFNTASGEPDTLTIELSDPRGATTRFTIAVTVHAVNDPPVISCPSWTFATLSIVDTSVMDPARIRLVSLVDPDAGDGLLTVTVSADELSTGQLVLTSSEGLSDVRSIDNLHLEFQGTVSAILATFAANRVRYFPTADDEIPVITITVNDQGNSGEGPLTSLTASCQMTITIWYFYP